MENFMNGEETCNVKDYSLALTVDGKKIVKAEQGSEKWAIVF